MDAIEVRRFATTATPEYWRGFHNWLNKFKGDRIKAVVLMNGRNYAENTANKNLSCLLHGVARSN